MDVSICPDVPIPSLEIAVSPEAYIKSPAAYEASPVPP